MLAGMWISGGRPALKLDATLEDYRDADLLEEAHFTARRWFEMEEHSDEGLHYFIELRDGRTLYLTGQYLYDFDPDIEDSSQPLPRRFPTSEFVIFRHKRHGYVLEVKPGGQILERELLLRRGDVTVGGLATTDGTILPVGTYEQAKRGKREDACR
jgi:hypothetical protein